MEMLPQFSISSPDVHTMELARFLTCLAVVLCLCTITFFKVNRNEKKAQKPSSFIDWYTDFNVKYAATPPEQTALTV